MSTINIFENGVQCSVEIKKRLKEKLKEVGISVPEELDPDAELIICIGGDGSLLQTLNRYNFPSTPIVGVNTGHLGFFQELQPDDIDGFIDKFRNDEFNIQKLYPVVAEVNTDAGPNTIKGLNEIVVKDANSHTIHLEIYIGNRSVEDFSGDGILAATPQGSTAYNYALGGSIVDPRLELLQVTPIAPINSSAYKSFTSSILLPHNLCLRVVPIERKTRETVITADGIQRSFSGLKDVQIRFSDKPINLLRFANYDFWKKVKMKLL